MIDIVPGFEKSYGLLAYLTEKEWRGGIGRYSPGRRRDLRSRLCCGVIKSGYGHAGVGAVRMNLKRNRGSLQMFVRHKNKVINLAQASSLEPCVADPYKDWETNRIYIRFPSVSEDGVGHPDHLWDDLVFDTVEDMWRAFEMICDKLAKNAYYVNLNKQN